MSEVISAEQIKALAGKLFNRVWELIENTDRTEAEELEMIHSAHASRQLWQEVGGPQQRGEIRVVELHGDAQRRATAPAAELGGGCEIAVACAKRVVAMESYIGLVEVGVGLVPGAGGLAYIARRAAERAWTDGAQVPGEQLRTRFPAQTKVGQFVGAAKARTSSAPMPELPPVTRTRRAVS